MPTDNVHVIAFGGVDDQSTPVNYPAGRSVRCKNWTPQRNGSLRLRFGYTKPAMSTVDTFLSQLHSAIYYEQFNGTQYVLYSGGEFGFTLRRLAIASGAVTTVGGAGEFAGNRWGHFRANNRIFIGDGTYVKSYDGATLREFGIPAPSAAQVSGAAVSFSTATAGSFSTANPSLVGFQFYMAYYNPATGHVGNRAAIGARTTVPGSGRSAVLTGLPNLTALGADQEWLKAIGMTAEGGQVPYWLLNSTGSRVVVSNTGTTATITLPNLDFTAELPTRNAIGSGFTAFAKVGTRIFGIKTNDPYVYYCEAEEDAVNGFFVGRPEESWPANNAEAFPVNEVPIGIHAHDYKGWFFSRNWLLLWDESMKQQLTLPWVGPWQVGIAGQRAFVSTPYGPFWVTANKQLYGFSSGPIDMGNEYTRTLLARIGNAYLGSTEMTYHCDPAKGIEHIKVLCWDSSGTPFIIIHDFKLKDEKSPYGQAYEYVYAGLTPKTFVGSGYSPQTPIRDANGVLRNWTGDNAGFFAQLDDGYTDGGATYSADFISGFAAMGDDAPQVAELELLGDDDVTVSYSFSADDELADFIDVSGEPIDESDSRFGYKISDNGCYLQVRFQLTSNLTENFAISAPYNVPLVVYGTIYSATLKIGASQPEGRD